MRLIDADALREKATNAKKYDPEMMVVGLGYVYSAPTIDPVKHGRWTHGGDGTMKCTHCRSRLNENPNFRYCPRCGARMDADE